MYRLILTIVVPVLTATNFSDATLFIRACPLLTGVLISCLLLSHVLLPSCGNEAIIHWGCLKGYLGHPKSSQCTPSSPRPPWHWREGRKIESYDAYFWVVCKGRLISLSCLAFCGCGPISIKWWLRASLDPIECFRHFRTTLYGSWCIIPL